jgi:hypothetical protein
VIIPCASAWTVRRRQTREYSALMVGILRQMHLPARRGRPDHRARDGSATTPSSSSNACEVS